MVTLALMIISYWFPTLLAFHWRHRNRVAILIVNCFFGWTIVGWVITLIWACNDNREAAPGAQLQARSY
jgi:hypothetical protein